MCERERRMYRVLEQSELGWLKGKKLCNLEWIYLGGQVVRETEEDFGKGSGCESE